MPEIAWNPLWLIQMTLGHNTLWNLPSHAHVPLANIQSDSAGEGNG
jgi:hypothetical protein